MKAFSSKKVGPLGISAIYANNSVNALISKEYVMARLVRATHSSHEGLSARGVDAVGLPETAVSMGPPDKPGDDDVVVIELAISGVR